MATSIWQRDDGLMMQAGALAAVLLLVLCLSALGVFALMSVAVLAADAAVDREFAGGAWRQHAPGAHRHPVPLRPSDGGRQHSTGGALVLWAVALGQGPSGRPADDVPLFAGYVAATGAVMLGACLLASIGPARRALRVNPMEALRDA